MELALAHRREIVAQLKKIGYLWVSLDLNGLQSGSLNAQLKVAPKTRPE
jgi:PP-loop superfamily ATP-utilizing enzyme